MIFVNDGVIQLATHPLQIAFDLTALFKAIYDKSEEDGAGTELASSLITFAEKLAIVPDDEIEQFFASLPKDQPIGFEEMIPLLDDWMAAPFKSTGYCS
jgi:hypothetical protein